MLLFGVLFCFPVFLPATSQNMNYLSVVVVGLGIFVLALWWGGKRKTFTGPHIDLAGLEVLSDLTTGRTASIGTTEAHRKEAQQSPPAM